MKINQSFIKRNIGGECVLIPTGETSRDYHGLFTLSATGEFLWDHLEQAGSLEELCAMLMDEYEVDAETAKQDTVEFLSRLLGAGFVVLSDPAQNW